MFELLKNYINKKTLQQSHIITLICYIIQQFYYINIFRAQMADQI